MSASIIGFASRAQATITILGATNASNFDQTTSPATIYGGNAGISLFTGTPDPNAPVNTCTLATAATPLIACNDAAIHPQLQMTIGIQSDSKDGYPVLYITPTTGGVAVPIQPVAPPAFTTHGNPAYVTVTWATVCAAIQPTNNAIDGNCNVTAGQLIRAGFNIGISSNNNTTLDDPGTVQFVISSDAGQGTDGQSTADVCTNTTSRGICHFEVGPGDQKVAIKTLQGNNALTGTTGLTFSKLRVLWVPGKDQFAQITAASDHSDLNITSSTTDGISLDNSRIEGFDNDTTYSFKVAAIDPTGNVGYYTGDANGTTDPDHYCDFTANPANHECHVATPGEVVGVLSKDVNCFIATAAFGSAMAPQVETFRQFRNAFLLPTRWGLKFVRFYYAHSPKYAHFIARHPTLRALARGCLYPLLVYATLSLKMGPAWAGLLTTLLFGALGVAVLVALGSARKALQRVPRA